MAYAISVLRKAVKRDRVDEYPHLAILSAQEAERWREMLVEIGAVERYLHDVGEELPCAG